MNYFLLCIVLLGLVQLMVAPNFPSSEDNPIATERFLKRLSPSLRKKLEKFKEENAGKDFVDEEKFARENLTAAELKQIQDALMMSLHGEFGEAVDNVPEDIIEAKKKGQKIGKRKYERKAKKKKDEL